MEEQRHTGPSDGSGRQPSGKLAFSSLGELALALSRGETSSSELVEAFLERANRLDPKLHAYAQLFEETARAAAKAADTSLSAGHRIGPLQGIPIAIKEIFDLAGQATTAGSDALTDRQPAVSAHAVRRLEAAGMIVLGKTRMVEFAFGGWGTNPVKGTPWNPWDLATHRVPGGSSSGSAVAVAAGLAPAALGTDTGGSVRTPACWCGLVGMKTSLGLIGRGGVVPLCPTHDSVGPLTRSVRDAALLLQALAGTDPEDPTTADAPTISPLVEIENGIEGFRLGVLGEGDLALVEPQVRQLFCKALSDLESLGATVEEIRLPLSIEEYLAGGGDIMGFGLRSETQLADLCGISFAFDTTQRQWLPVQDPDGRADVEGIYLAGDGAVVKGADAAELSGARAAHALLCDLGRSESAGKINGLNRRLAGFDRFRHALDSDAFPFPRDLATSVPDGLMICRCEGVSAGELRRSVTSLGATELNRTKAFTRVAMGRCQGRICGAAAAEILAESLGVPIEAVGRLRGQAPVKPVPMHSLLAGGAP